MPKSTYTSIGMISPNYEEYMEIMFKAAHTYDCSSVFTVGNRWSSTNTPEAQKRKAEYYPPYAYFQSFAHFLGEHLKKNVAELVLVETRTISDEAEPLEHFVHPGRAIYLFTGRDSVFSPEVLASTPYRIKVSDDPRMSPGTAGAIVLYDRHLKEVQAKASGR